MPFGLTDKKQAKSLAGLFANVDPGRLVVKNPEDLASRYGGSRYDTTQPAVIAANVGTPPSTTAVPQETAAAPQQDVGPTPAEKAASVVKAGVAAGEKMVNEVSKPPEKPIPKTDREALLARIDSIGNDEMDYIKKNIASYKKGSAKTDLSALVGLVDSWTGSNLLRAYKKPQSSEEKQMAVAGLMQYMGKRQTALAAQKEQFRFEVQAQEQKKSDARDRYNLGIKRIKSAGGGSLLDLINKNNKAIDSGAARAKLDNEDTLLHVATMGGEFPDPHDTEDLALGMAIEDLHKLVTKKAELAMQKPEWRGKRFSEVYAKALLHEQKKKQTELEAANQSGDN